MSEQNPEWIHPAIEKCDELIAAAEAGEKIGERVHDELRPLIVELAALDPREH